MARTVFERKVNTLATKKPKSYPKSGKLINAGSYVGTKIVQLTTVKPLNYGLKKARGKR